MAADRLTRENTKIIVLPVDHSTSRFTRRTWAAAVTLRDDEAVRQGCGHTGHRTTAAAIECATRLWKKLA